MHHAPTSLSRPRRAALHLAVLAVLAALAVACGAAPEARNDELLETQRETRDKASEPDHSPVEKKAQEKKEDGEADDGATGADEPMRTETEPQEMQAAPAAQDIGIAIERSGDDGVNWARRRATRRLDAAVAQLRTAATTLEQGGGACGATCELAAAICDSRDVICEIAGQYREAAGADCAWARAECDDAQGLCRACGGRP